MRNVLPRSVFGAALLLIWCLPLMAGDKAEAISVDLKAFKFKVKEDQQSLFGHDEAEGKLFFYTNGPAEAAVKVPADGTYDIVLKASCTSAQNERARFKVSLDGQPVGKETTLSDDDVKEYKLTATLKAGERKLTIEFTNDAYKENEFDRNLFVHEVTLKRAK
jgi:hypothetical protein